MNEPERLLSRSPGASSAEHRGEHVGTKKSRTDLVQQLADSAPALVAAARSIDGLQLQRELLKLIPHQAEAARIDRFRCHRTPFAEAFAELQHELADLVRADRGCVYAPSACAILSARVEAMARVLDGGAIPDHASGEWGDLATMVSCEVGALRMSVTRRTELVAQLEAFALPLLEFTRDAHRRGFAEESPAVGDTDRAHAMLPPFEEAVEQLSPLLHVRRRGVRLELAGGIGTSACGALQGMASALARCLESASLPRDRPGLVGEGLSLLLTPAWWDRLWRHLQHELDLLAGRATEEIEPGAPTRPAKGRIPAKIAHQILHAIATDTAGVLISWSAIAKAIGCRNESTVRREGIRLVNDRCIEQVDGRMTPYRLLPRGREILSR